MPIHRRLNWEFLATLDGLATAVTDTDPDPPMRPPTLWLFPPEVRHGWTSKDPKGTEVVVLHYSELDPAVERIVRRDRWLAAPLSPEDIAPIREMGGALWSHYWRPTMLGGFHADLALAKLYLIMLRHHPECNRPAAPKTAIAIVEAAERWILNHIADNKAVSDAARAVDVSSSHLYRLIKQIRGCSPRRLLLRLRFETAKRLMGESDLKLEGVARECGFSDASAFCRAFRATYGCSPARWRAEYHICYRQPSPEDRHDPTLHRYPGTTPAFDPGEADLR